MKDWLFALGVACGLVSMVLVTLHAVILVFWG